MDIKSTKSKILKDLWLCISIVLIMFFSASLFEVLGEYNDFKAYYGHKSIYDTNEVKNNFFTLDMNLNDYTNLFLDLDGSIKDGRLGKALSDGCIRLEKINAKWIYDNIPEGTKVYIN